MTSRIPVDSAEARELREIEAAQAEEHAPARPVHDSTCREGWIGEDADGRPAPCPTCKPHLFDHRCTTCDLPQSRCAGQRARVGQRCCTHCRHRITEDL